MTSFSYQKDDHTYNHGLVFTDETIFKRWDQPRMGLIKDQESDIFGTGHETIEMSGEELVCRLYATADR
eukprot:UN05261